MENTVNAMDNAVNALALRAVEDRQVREELIREHEALILRTASVACRRFVTRSDDEWSIALWAFSRAVDDYSPTRGDFLPFAATLIRRDLIDIDPETLEPVKIDVTYDGMYTWTIPGEEFVYEGTGAAPAVKPGDVDADGRITSADARLALRRSVMLEDYPEGSAAYLACDVDHDGKVTSADARLILRGSVGLEDVAKW